MTTKIRDANGLFPPTLVSKLSIGKIAFVDAGAGKGVNVLLAKSKMEKANMNLEKLISTLTEFLAGLSPEMKAGAKAALEAAIGASEKPEEPAAPTEPVAAAASQVTPEVKKALDEKNAENVELKKRLDAIETEREIERFAKTAAELPYVPGMSTAEFGEHLRAVSKSLSTEAYDKVLKQYRAINAAISKSEIMKNVGSSVSPDGDSASAKIAKIADDIVAKQGVTFSKALSMAYAQNKNLVAEAAKETTKNATEDND